MRADDNQFITEVYDVRKLFRGDWYTIMLDLLSHGPRRPAELHRAAGTWALRDRWAQTTRRAGHAQIVETLNALVATGLVQRRELTGGFHRAVQYSLTVEGEECLAALDHLRHWLRRHPSVLKRAVHHYHQARSRDHPPPRERRPG